MPFFSSKKNAEFVIQNAYFADAAYEDGHLRAGMLNDGWDILTNKDLPGIINSKGFFQIGSAAARVFVNGDQTVISFRGSDDLNDIIFDDIIGIIGARGTNLGEYVDLFRKLIKAVTGSSEYGQNITLTGHSLGGAVVNEISKNPSLYGFKSNTQFVAFSSPYVSNKTYNYGHDNESIYKYIVKDSGFSFDNIRYFGYYDDGVTSTQGKLSSLRVHSVVAVRDTLEKIVASLAYKFIEKDTNVNSFGYSDKIYLIDGIKYNHFNIDKLVKSSGIVNIGTNNKYKGVDHTNNDLITGKFLFDTIVDGMAGNDNIDLGGGNDVIFGGAGNDILSGGAGSDKLYGGTGKDTFTFVKGDVLKGEVINGGDEKDIQIEANRISGYGDISFQLATITSISEIEFVGAGNFQFSASQISETGINPRSNVFASVEKDQLVFNVGTSKAGGTLNLSELKFNPKVAWSSSVDRLYLNGNAQADTITGTTQNDIITGAGGADTLRGGAGNDIFKFRDGDTADKEINGGLTTEINRISGYGTVLFNGTAIKSINQIQFTTGGKFYFDGSQISSTAISTTAEVWGSTGANELIFSVGNNAKGGKADLSKLKINSWSSLDRIYLTGFAMADTIVGSNQADTIKGGGGNDTITGGAGKDSLWGGLGNDTFRFASTDVIAGEVINGGSFANGEINSILTRGNVNFSTALVSFINALNFESAGLVTFKGQQVSNQNLAVTTAISGSSGLNQLSFSVSAAADPYDRSILSLAQFTFSGWESQDKISIYGSSGMDLLQGARKATYLSAGAEDDIVYGGAGDDTIIGGKGGDVLYGGDGDDRFVFESGDIESWEQIWGDGGINELAGKGDIDFRGTNGNIREVQNIHFLDSGIFTFDSSNWIFQFQEVIGSSGKDKLKFDNYGYNLDVSSLKFINWSSSDVIELRSTSGVVGTSLNDLIYGSGILKGGEGNDIIRGSGHLIGGKGIDKLYGEGGDDILVGDDAGDTLNGGGGYDTFDLWVPGVKWTNPPGSGKIVFHYNTTIDPSYISNQFGDYVIGSGATTLSFSMTGISIGEGGPSIAVTGNEKDNNVTYVNDNGHVLFRGYDGKDKISVSNLDAIGSLYFADFTSGEDKIQLSGIDSIEDYFSLKTEAINSGIYLQRYGTAKDWSVIKHTVSTHLQDGQVFVDVYNETLFTINSGADYMSNGDFII